MADEVPVIVIDNGSSIIKCGFGGDGAPRSIFPTIIGNPKPYIHQTDTYIGYEARANTSTHILKYPIEHGVVTNWDDMEKIWQHTFYNELRVFPLDHPVILTEPVKNPRINREKMIQIMFETFNVPSFYLGIQNIFSLLSTGRKTGISCELGDGHISVVPVFEGYYIKNAVKRINLGGRDVTNYLEKLLNSEGITFLSTARKQALVDIKKSLAYVADDFYEELQKAKSSQECDAEYSLPDGDIIRISDARFRCAELLFKPLMNELEMDSINKMIEMNCHFDINFKDGVDKMIYDSIMKCGIGARKALYSNIALSGGASMLNGLPERIEKEIKNLAPPTMKVNVNAPPYRKYSAWNGGSIFASLPSFSQNVVTHDEYNDAGPGIVHRRFL